MRTKPPVHPWVCGSLLEVLITRLMKSVRNWYSWWEGERNTYLTRHYPVWYFGWGGNQHMLDIITTGGDNMSFYAKCPREVHEILGIKVEPGIEQQFLENLRKSPEVAAAFISLGEYDIIALLGIEDPDELTRFVVENVRKTKGVLDTRTTVIERVRAIGPRIH